MGRGRYVSEAHSIHGSSRSALRVILELEVLPLIVTDVVPVDPATEQNWYYDPWSGYFDGKRIAWYHIIHL